jgi:hypothetical protein
MMRSLKRFYENFRGFDEIGSAVPMMDGPLKPNTALDRAAIALNLPDIDNLIATPGGLFCSRGPALLRLAPVLERIDTPILNAVSERSFPADITCLASDGAEALAIGLDGQGVTIHGGRHDGLLIDVVKETELRAPTAAFFLDRDTLIVANGSAEHLAAEWKRDLMNHGSSGSIWRVSLDTQNRSAVLLARDLAFPYGLATGAESRLLVSEAWRHRVIAIDPASPKAPRIVLADLPAYPARIVSTEDGYRLALFAPRNQLIEFVLREEAYRRRMVATIDPACWIAPALVSGISFLEPIQGGARKKLNMLKPWSPSWSYGLVVKCDKAMRPVASFHSRADGHVHGVTSLAQQGGQLFVGSKGSGVIVALDEQSPETDRD